LPNHISNSPKTLILVPQGAEYQAVRKNLKTNQNLVILPIPIGCPAVSIYLETLEEPQQFQQAIAMGLCGSLNPHLKVGDIAVYTECLDLTKLQTANEFLECCLKPDIRNKFTLVKALTSDRLIYLASEKQYLHQTTQTDVVDMEGYVILEFFKKLNIPVGMIRVVSDDSNYDLPNLDQAIDREGNLKPLELAIAFSKQPIAAFRLIQGSLKSLQVLSKVSLDLSLGQANRN
jgi:nucleoside phosphorylase